MDAAQVQDRSVEYFWLYPVTREPLMRGFWPEFDLTFRSNKLFNSKSQHRHYQLPNWPFLGQQHNYTWRRRLFGPCCSGCCGWCSRTQESCIRSPAPPSCLRFHHLSNCIGQPLSNQPHNSILNTHLSSITMVHSYNHSYNHHLYSIQSSIENYCWNLYHWCQPSVWALCEMKAQSPEKLELYFLGWQLLSMLDSFKCAIESSFLYWKVAKLDY